MEKSLSQNQQYIDGQLTARLFKYYSQFNNKKIIFKLPLNKTPYRILYSRFKKQFDNLALVFNKQNINIQDYIKWCVINNKMQIYDIPKKLLDLYTINQYFNYLKIKLEHKKIFKLFENTVETIAKDCIKYNFNYAVDYFHFLIKNRKLAQYHFTGKISKYYFVMIPKFKEIINKLDKLSKEEFNNIYNMFDKYHNDIVESMEQELGKIVMPFSYTNERIQQIKLKNNV